MREFLAKAVGAPWVDRGRDYAGWDCWGLVVCFYRDVLKITLNVYQEVSAEQPMPAMRTAISEASRWQKIEPGREQCGDVALWRPLHAGVIIQPGKMLHCLGGSETVIEQYRNMLWEKRLIGFYRHPQSA